MRKLFNAFLLTTALVVMHVLCYAEQSDTKEKTSGTVNGTNIEVGDSLLIDDLRILLKIKSLRNLLEEEQKTSNKWDVSLTANFSGDEAGDQNKSELITSTTIKKGIYPRQLRFEEEGKIELADDKFEEDVTRLLLNYDYYITPHIEVYAFLERFEDGYMGVKRRFEIGFGGLVEWTLGDLVNEKEIDNKKDIKELFKQISVDREEMLQRYSVRYFFSQKDPLQRTFEQLSNGQKDTLRQAFEQLSNGQKDSLQRTFEQLSNGQKDSLRRAFEQLPDSQKVSLRRAFEQLSDSQKDSLQEDYETALTSMKKRSSRWKFSIATTLFKELEELEVKDITNDTTYSHEPEERYRIVFRPSIEYQAANGISLSGFCYLKAPVFGQFRVDDKIDYRVDAQFLAKLKLSEDEQGNDKVILTFGYDLRYDNAPPYVELNGEKFTANKLHETTTLGITVEF